MSGTIAYNENETIDFLYHELDLGNWWKELLVFEDNGTDVDVDRSAETISWSENRTAKIVSTKFGSRLSYVEINDQWYTWNGTIHVPCEGVSTVRKLLSFYVTAIEYALDHIESVIEARAAQVRKENKDGAGDKAKAILGIYKNGFKKHRDFRDRLNSNAGMVSLVSSLKSEVAVSSKYYENDHEWFVMRNCVMDLVRFRNGHTEDVLVPHDPSRPVTKYFDADYDPETNFGDWDRFLMSSLPNELIRNYLQEVYGAAFMATSKTKVICNYLGKKDSGKSVLIDAIHNLCQGGAGYSSMPDALAIMKVQGQNFGHDKFRGPRHIAISEPDENQTPDTGFLKRFSGDDVMESADKYAKSSSWRPQGILFIASNNPLKINIRDNASVDRIKIIEFPNQFKPAGPDVPPELVMIPDIKERIAADRNRVLMWIIEGMIRFRDNGLVFDEPAEVVVSQDEFVKGSTSALEWIDDMLEDNFIKYDLDAPISSCLSVKDAFDSYMYWCTKETNTKPVSRKFFVQDLVARYGETKRSSGIRLPGIVPTTGFEMKYNPAANGYVGRM